MNEGKRIRPVFGNKEDEDDDDDEEEEELALSS